MRSRSQMIVALALVGAVSAAPYHEAQAGKVGDMFRRNTAAKVGAAGVGGALLATHPVTAPVVAGGVVAAKAVGGVALGAVAGTGHAVGTAFLAAAAVSPLGAAIMAGATIGVATVGAVKGAKFIARKIRERRARKEYERAMGGAGGIAAGDEIGEEMFDQPRTMGGMPPGASRGRQSPSMMQREEPEFDPAAFEEEQRLAGADDDIDLRNEFGPPSQGGPSAMMREPSQGLGPTAGRPPSQGLGGAPIVGGAPTAGRPPSQGAGGGPSLIARVNEAPIPSAGRPPSTGRGPSRVVAPVAAAVGTAAVVAGPSAGKASPMVPRAPGLIGTATSRRGKPQEVYQLANGNTVKRTTWGLKNGTQMVHESEHDTSGAQLSSRSGKADKFSAIPGAKLISEKNTRSGKNKQQVYEMDDGSRVRVTRWTQGTTPMISVAQVDGKGKTIEGTRFQGSEAKYNEMLATQGGE